MSGPALQTRLRCGRTIRDENDERLSRTRARFRVVFSKLGMGVIAKYDVEAVSHFNGIAVATQRFLRDQPGEDMEGYTVTTEPSSVTR